MDGHIVRSINRDAKRQAILEIARDIFMKEGFAAASMSAIAARVGGSKGTLYNYFPSKEDLFIAVVEDRCETTQSAVFDLTGETTDFDTALRGLGERFLTLMLSDENIALHRLVIAEAGRFPEIGRTLYEAGPKRGHARLTVFLNEAMARGCFQSANTARSAEQMMTLCLGDLYRQRLWNVRGAVTAEEVRTQIDAAHTAFMDAHRSVQPA
jgi:AcrR family transcriptional regulator